MGLRSAFDAFALVTSEKWRPNVVSAGGGEALLGDGGLSLTKAGYFLGGWQWGGTLRFP